LYKRSFYVILAVFLMVLLGVTVMAENHSTESNSTAQLTVFTDLNVAKTITSVDIPPAGKSLGDAYYFNGTLRSTNATDGPIIGELFGSTTTVKMSSTKSTGQEERLAYLIFTFNNKTDQIIVGSVSDYPVQENTLEKNESVVRPILGGTGKYMGVRGQEVSTRNADDSYTHVFTLLR
jgi:hypothetical protein